MPGDPRRGTKVREVLDGEIGKPVENYANSSHTGTFSVLQLSITERIAATFGQARGLLVCIQFFRARATGHMEFSAGLVLSCNSGLSAPLKDLVDGDAQFRPSLSST